MEGAEWRFEREPPAEPGAVLLLRRGVARGAAADQEHGPPVPEIWGICSERARRHGRRRRDEPERRKPDRAGKDDKNHEPAQHGEFLFVALMGTSLAPV